MRAAGDTLGTYLLKMENNSAGQSLITVLTRL